MKLGLSIIYVKLLINKHIIFSFMTYSLSQHLCLSLTPEGVKNIRKGQGDVPLFDAELAKVKVEIDALS